jgi:UDPglucose 6-dehydrogenase
MKIAVVGGGYVGLVTGACLAELGHGVVCADVDPNKVESINRGRPTVHEAGLDELLAANVPARLRATTDVREAVLASQVTFIAVGTPLHDGEIDLRFVASAAEEIGFALRDSAGYHVVAVKSTVVPGTTEDVVVPILERASQKRVGHAFGVGVNPEFLTEGQAVDDFMRPDRIVLGGLDARTLDVLEAVYRPFEDVKKVRTTPKTAEMIKYASNALLATAISFANEIGNLCAVHGELDVVEVMRGVHLSRYLSLPSTNGSPALAPIVSFLEAGCGFGGSCLPKDVRALIAHGRKAGQPMELLDAVMRVNERQPGELIDALRRELGSLQGLQVTVLGLAFKPGTDDTRESPAFPVIERLLSEGAAITVYDPIARTQVDGVSTAPDLESAVEAADAIVLVTRWPEFEALPRLLARLEREPVVLDGRRMLDKHAVARYAGVGV